MQHAIDQLDAPKTDHDLLQVSSDDISSDSAEADCGIHHRAGTLDRTESGAVDSAVSRRRRCKVPRI